MSEVYQSTDTDKVSDGKNPVLREQVEENFRFAAAASVGGLVNAAILAAVIWSSETATALLGWGCLIVLGTTLRFWALNENKRDKHKQMRAITHSRRIEAVALINGFTWGAGTVLFTHFASPTH